MKCSFAVFVQRYQSPRLEILLLTRITSLCIFMNRNGKKRRRVLQLPASNSIGCFIDVFCSKAFQNASISDSLIPRHAYFRSFTSLIFFSFFFFETFAFCVSRISQRLTVFGRSLNLLAEFI